jgi:hypothetical protein
MIGKPQGRLDICKVSGRDRYPLLHLISPVPEWQAGYLQGFRTGSLSLHPVSPVPEWAVRISAPFPGRIVIISPFQPRNGVAVRISAPFPDWECYPLLHSVRPVPEWAGWISAPGNPDRYPLLHPVSLVPEWQAGYLQGFRTGSVIRSFTLSTPYRSGRPDICKVSGPGVLSAPSPCQPRT